MVTSSLGKRKASPISNTLAADQVELRRLVREAGGVAFIANGSILPDLSTELGSNIDHSRFVPFESPPSFEREFVLPTEGVVKGMLIPSGVTVIVGGGFHGKSTLLNALKGGIYDRPLASKKQFVVCDETALSIRSEDMRYVGGIDISAFVNDLPEASKIDTRDFWTNNASGSTSMAANVIEAIEGGSKLFLLDEDTCASNFMIKDSRMRSMVGNDPITPFIYRVNGLYKELGISTIVVVGGAGDWFDVHDQTIMLDNYKVLDVTKRAKSISKTFCTGRVQYNGQGLVHQLEWPCEVRQRKLQMLSIAGKEFADGLKDFNIEYHKSYYDWCSDPISSNFLKEYISVALTRFHLEVDDGNIIYHRKGPPTEERRSIDLSKIDQRLGSRAESYGVILVIYWLMIFAYMERCITMLPVVPDEGDDIHSIDLNLLMKPYIDILPHADEVSEAITIDGDTWGLLKFHKVMGSDVSVRMKKFTSTGAITKAGGVPMSFLSFSVLKCVYEERVKKADFVWPRPFLLRAAINRIRGARFSATGN
jgi:hypothetical protein